MLIKLTDKEKYSLLNYDYDLPPELIAHEPLMKRDHSKLMLLERKDESQKNLFFYNLPDFLHKDDLLILNNTRVLPAKLIGKREDTGGRIELLLIQKNNKSDHLWEALVKPGKKARSGTRIIFEEKFTATVEKICDNGHRIISFDRDYKMDEILNEAGRVPLPPYIKKEIENPERYQTVYSKEEGSVAAPTAGFHFTDDIFRLLDEKGVKKVFLTLHIGPGTFQPVKYDDIRSHNMHREYFDLSRETAEIINATKNNGGRIIAVGTTSCRVLESAVKDNGTIGYGSGWTDIFIYPGFNFRAIDGLITNFHLPRSTLFMLVSAFAGTDFIKDAYQEAIKKRYRFYSFGDAMLIL